MSRKAVDVVRLSSESDWAGIKDRYDGLFRRFGCCPFMDYLYLHLNWTSFYPETTCWYLEFRDEQAAVVAAGIYREFVHTESQLKPKALRSIDHTMFMAINPFMYDMDRASKAFETVAASLYDVRKATGADMFSLFRMCDRAADGLVNALAGRGLYVRREDCLQSASIDLAVDAAEFQAIRKRQIRETKRIERKTAEAFPDGIGFEDIRTWELSDADFEAVLGRLDGLESKTWQNSWERSSDRVDVELTARFNHAAMRQWRNAGLLNLYFQTINGQDASYFMTLESDGRIWALKTGFDPEYAEYGVGKQVFYHTVMRKLDVGPRVVMELGGGANDWKLRWNPDIFALQKIEWALPSVKGRAWQLFQRGKAVFKKFRPAKSVPGAAAVDATTTNATTSAEPAADASTSGKDD